MSVWLRTVAVALLAWPAAASATTCRLTVPPFNFGTYSPGDSAPLDIAGLIDVRCNGQTGPFSVTLSPGSSGSFAQREMVSGPYLMRYNFYVNAGRTIVWGDGTNGSSPVNGFKSRPAPGQENFSLSVYGRVFPAQAVGEGLYRDDVIVTVVF